jgi:hypothetical protein
MSSHPWPTSAGKSCCAFLDPWRWIRTSAALRGCVSAREYRLALAPERRGLALASFTEALGWHVVRCSTANRRCFPMGVRVAGSLHGSLAPRCGSGAADLGDRKHDVGGHVVVETVQTGRCAVLEGADRSWERRPDHRPTLPAECNLEALRYMEEGHFEERSSSPCETRPRAQRLHVIDRSSRNKVVLG